jgi:cytosine/uracil/thiamine/allantoin permease
LKQRALKTTMLNRLLRLTFCLRTTHHLISYLIFHLISHLISHFISHHITHFFSSSYFSSSIADARFCETFAVVESEMWELLDVNASRAYVSRASRRLFRSTTSLVRNLESCLDRELEFSTEDEQEDRDVEIRTNLHSEC